MIYALLLSVTVVAVSVLVHYEFLYRVSRISSKVNIRHRFRVVLGVVSALIAHSLEVSLFGVVYYVLNKFPDWGRLEGSFNGGILDCVYYSFTTFTTLGFGDITPIGHLRLLTGLESLTGLVLITWSASFVYYEMQRNWQKDD